MGLLTTPGHRPRTATHDPTTRGPPAGPGAGPTLHQPDLPAALHTPGRGAPDDRPSHRRQPVAHAPATGTRAPHRLPPRPVPRAVVRAPARVRPGAVPTRPRSPRRSGHAR